MERNVFICIIVSVFIITASTNSSSKKSHEKAKETPSQSTTLTTSDSPATLNTTVGANKSAQSLNETISKRSSRGRLKDRRYISYNPSPQYAPAPPTAYDYCPPLASSCPSCISFSSQLPEDICSYSVVMKVLMLSPPSTDVYGKVCGKLGLLAGLANTDIKQYRRLLRLSVSESCECILSASTQYILISKPSAFLKDGSLNSKISLSDEVIMLPVDRYTEAVTLKPLEQCYLKPQPDANEKQSSEYIELPIQPRNYRTKVIPPPTPPPPELYLPPNPYPYYQPPPSTFYAPPYPQIAYPLAGPITYKLPSFLPFITNCLQEESCPKCVQPGDANLEQIYCTSDFAYIALVTFPDLSKAKGDYSNPYDAGSCLNLRTTVLHDVSKNSDTKLLSIQQNFLLPKQCSCFPQLKGFAIVLLLGHYTNTPIYEATPQLKKEFTLVYLPAPSEISIPNCVSYTAPTPYVPPVQDLQVNSIPNCPYGFETSCPSCFPSIDQSFIDEFCSANIAIIAELQGSGAYAVLAPKIPSVQITMSEDEYSYKSILIKVMKSSPPSCIEGSLKILQLIKPQQDLYTLANIIPFTVLSECLLECPLLTAPGTKLLLFTSKDTMFLPNGVIQLTDGIYLAPLGIYETMPSCPQQYLDPAPYVPPTSSPAKFPDYPTVYSVVASMVDNPEATPAKVYKPNPLPVPIYPKEYKPLYETTPPPAAPYKTAPPPPPPSYENSPPTPAPYKTAPPPPPPPYENSPPPPYKTAAPQPPPYETAPPPLPQYQTPPPQLPYKTAPPPLPYKTAPPPPPYKTAPPPPPYKTAPPPPPYKTAPPPPPYKTSPPPSYKTAPPYVTAAPQSYKTAPPPYATVAPPPSKTDPPPYVTAAPPPYSPLPQPPPTTAQPPPYVAPPSPPYTDPPPPPYETIAPPPYKAPSPPPYTAAPTPPYKAVPKLPIATTLPPYTAAPPSYASVPSPPPAIPPKTIVPHTSTYASAEYKPCLENDFSCPECSYSLPPNFKDAYCTADTAILVAVGLNYQTNKEYEDTMQLAFEPLGPYHINIQSGVYGPGLDVTVSPFTPLDLISKQNAAANQLCFKSTVRALYDVTIGSLPKKLSLDIDVYLPALCPDCPVFLQSPTYAVLLSKKLLYLNGPIQLTNQFGFYPLPKETFSLPDCYSASDYSPDPLYTVLAVDKYQVPAYPAGKQLSCDYPPVCLKCPDPPLYPYFEIPCDQKLALVVEIVETSTGKPGAPTLEVTVYQKQYDYYATNIVALNIKDSPPALDTSGPYKSANSCKYAKVKVIQDLSPYPVVPPGTILTVLAASDCDCNIFSISQGFGILLAPEYTGTTITIGPASAIVLPFGYSSISLCSVILPTYAPPVPPIYPPPVPPILPPPVPDILPPPVPDILPPQVPDILPPPVPDILPPQVPDILPPPVSPILPPPVKPIIAPPPVPVTSPPLVPPVPPVTKPPLPPPVQVDVKYGLQPGSTPTLPCNENAGCSTCGNSAAITENPDVYCDSLLVFLVRISKIENDKEGQCASGAAISLYEITASKPAQKAVLNIFFTLPQKCLCPQLVVDKFALLMFHKSVPITNPLVLTLDSSFHLYSVPKGRLTLPFCAISQFASRTKDLDEIFVDPVDNELTLLRRKELDLQKCPTNERSCPNCDYMETEDLKELICSSDFAFEVTMNPNVNQGPRRQERHERISVSQRPANNFSIDIVVKPYEDPDTCNAPVEEGNCNSELEKFYYDANDHDCKEFIYSGCNGNANNFNSYKECEESCLREGYCDEGNLYVQNNPRNKLSENLSKSDLKYFIGEDCDCPSLIPDPYCKYLVYNSTEIKHKKAMHLSKDFYLIPLTDGQRAAPITCDSIESSTVYKTRNHNIMTQESQHHSYSNEEYNKNNIITDNDEDVTTNYAALTKNDKDYLYTTKFVQNSDERKIFDDVTEKKYYEYDEFTTEYDTYTTTKYEDTKYEKNYDSEENYDLENNKEKNLTDEYVTDELNNNDDGMITDEDTLENTTKKNTGWFG